MSNMRAALTYISSPTMGLPAGADAAEFCMNGASEANVRLALRACIWSARQALEIAEAEDRVCVEHGYEGSSVCGACALRAGREV